MRTGRRERRERAVLIVGGASAAALAWAALAPWGHPEVAAQMELERRTSESADLVRLEWEELLRADEAPALDAGEPLTWTLSDLEPGPRTAAVDRAAWGSTVDAFDVLLADASTVEDEDPARALAQVTEALDGSPGAARRPEGLLRAIQLAVRADDLEAAQTWWQRVRNELSWRDARGEMSYRLLCGFAAAPALAGAERAEIQRELTAAWVSGELALPAAQDVWTRRAGPPARWSFERDARLDVLTERLVALSGEHADAARATIDMRGRRARALERAVGQLPAAPDDGRWHAFALAGSPEVLIVRRRGAAVDGGFASAAELVTRLAGAVELSEGFEVSHEPSGADESIELVPGALSVRVSHTDPRALVRAEVGRVRGLRLAFGALAIICALASAATYRALRREGRLAALERGFIAGVSHDLRTPLASILLMAENLESGRVSSDTARERYYGAIRREAGRLRRLVDDVLDFSRIERGERPKLALEEVDLAHFVDELSGEVRESVERKGVSFRVEASELPNVARLDTEAVRRSVWNLVDNALTHSGSDEIAFAVRGEGASALVLEVCDRGCGVPPELAEEVFRPFARVNGSGAHTRGTGLGLAIVREVARAHGGDATVEPGTDGVGAVFRMRITIEAAANEQARSDA